MCLKRKKKKRKDPAGSTRQKLISSYKKRNETIHLFHTGSKAAVIHQVLSEIRERERACDEESKQLKDIFCLFFIFTHILSIRVMAVCH